jgi:hypothetical protein
MSSPRFFQLKNEKSHLERARLLAVRLRDEIKARNHLAYQACNEDFDGKRNSVIGALVSKLDDEIFETAEEFNKFEIFNLNAQSLFNRFRQGERCFDDSFMPLEYVEDMILQVYFNVDQGIRVADAVNPGQMRSDLIKRFRAGERETMNSVCEGSPCLRLELMHAKSINEDPSSLSEEIYNAETNWYKSWGEPSVDELKKWCSFAKQKNLPFSVCEALLSSLDVAPPPASSVLVASPSGASVAPDDDSIF